MKLNNLSEKEKEFVTTISYLGTVYNKTFSEEDLTVWYDLLGEYPDEVLVKVIKNLAKTEKFLPAISTIIEECDKYRELDRFEVLEYMREKNYFKNGEEYFKAKQWLREKTIPSWFKGDLTKFYNEMLNTPELNYVKTKEMPKALPPQELEIETFECQNCHETRLLVEMGSSEVCLQDNVCIYCQEQGYGRE